MHISYRSRMFISGMFDLINLLQQNVLEDCRMDDEYRHQYLHLFYK